MSESDDASLKRGGADRIEAMLAGFNTAAATPPVAPAPPPPPPASAPPPATQRRPRDDAVRPLWQAEGGRAAAPRSPWWQTRPVWALVGLLVGIAASQGWQALRQQQQRDLALASVSLQQPVLLAPATALRAVEPAPITAARPAATPPAVPASAPPVLPVATPLSIVEEGSLAPALVPAAPAVFAPPAAVPGTSPGAAPAKQPPKQPPKPDSPAARCKQAKGAEFQRCLQVQCRKDRYFAHRQCIALYERNAKP